MRVLFVSSGNGRNGISPITKSQADSLTRNNVEIRHFLVRGKGLKSYMKAIPRLKKVLGQEHHDIVHAHYGLCGLVSYLAKSNEKLIVSFMGDDLMGSARKDGSYTFVSRIFVGLNKYLARRSDFVITKSNSLRNVLSGIVDLAVIPNGVNFENFFPLGRREARSKLDIPSTQRLILFVSDPARPEKNYPLAKEAFDLLDIPDKELKVLHGMAQKELNLYYNAADVLLLTSFHEGSPNVVKEALACNCKVVSTNVGDVAELIADIPGCHITAFNAKDVSDKLMSSLINGTKSHPRDSIQHLEINRVAKRVIDIYHKAIGQQSCAESAA